MPDVSSHHLRSQRGFLRVVAAGLLTVLAACNSGPGVATHLADYVPYAAHGVDTDLIFPREQGGASRFLVRNWPPQRTLRGDTMWVHGDWARVGFFSVADEPSTFVIEAIPFSHPAAPQQTLTLILNGTEITTVPMPPRWETYEFELPAEHVLTGWNEMMLDFAHNLRPADFDPESNDRRTLAARFRRLEMRHPLGRPYWPERIEEVRLVGGAAPSAEAGANDESAPPSGATPAEAAIEMPTDSFLEVYLVPDRDTEVIGDLEVTFAEGAPEGDIHVVAEAVEPELTTRIWDQVLSSSGDARLRADLSPWAGRPVGLRIRVFGSTNGVARWTGLGTTTPAEGPEAALDPASILSPPRSGVLDRPDIFVILLDAARADAFDGSRGPDLTPNVARLAADGTRFTQAWAPSSWTGQTIPALLTGMAPDAVGIESWASTLPPAVIKLPEILFDAGYYTALWTQHNIYGRGPQLRHGFERITELDPAVMANRASLPPADWMLTEDRPTFAFIHLLAPHTPYDPPAPFSGSRSSWYDDPYRADVDTLMNFDEVVPEDPELRDRIRRFAIARYEENVQFADHLVGRLIDTLSRADRYEDALIVLLADHGEAFLEHGKFLHTRYLFEEFLHVPFIVKWPRGLERLVPVIDAPVTLLDLAPTIVDALGIDDERARYQGRSLMPLVAGEPARNRMLYAYTSNGTTDGGSRPVHALRWGDMKLIWERRRGTTNLYDLASDPGELDDVALELPFHRAMMEQVLKVTLVRNQYILTTLGGAQVDELDEATIRSLRALGYLR